MIYSLAPSERINTGKTWPVYTIRLHALGHHACIWHIVQCIAWVQVNACARQDPGSKRTHLRPGRYIPYGYVLLGIMHAYGIL